MAKVDYLFGIQRTFSDMKKFIIGVIISAIPLVNLAALGYQLEAGLLTLKKKEALPEWTDWLNLFVRGFFLLLIELVYLLPSMIVLFAGLGSVIWPVISAAEVETLQESSFWLNLAAQSLPVLLLSFALGLIAVYLIPAALFRYGETGSPLKAFEIGYVYKKAAHLSYFVVWLVVLVISTLLTLLLTPVPFIGGGLVSFVAGIFSFTCFGQIYKEL